MRQLPIAALMVAAVVTACSDDKQSYVKNVGDGESTPTMLTTDVHTFISDSGYTRYYITAPEWRMHDEAKEPFWKFPYGISLEQYDRNLNVTSTMVCDSATYLSQKRLWRLDGNVVMVNELRDSFVTQQVFWNQIKREVYSDSFIHIVRADRVIEGYGFTSNEPITAYTVKRPTGIFPVKQDGLGAKQEASDSVAPAAPRRRPTPSRRPSPADTMVLSKEM